MYMHLDFELMCCCFSTSFCTPSETHRLTIKKTMQMICDYVWYRQMVNCDLIAMAGA